MDILLFDDPSCEKRLGGKDELVFYKKSGNPEKIKVKNTKSFFNRLKLIKYDVLNLF